MYKEALRLRYSHLRSQLSAAKVEEGSISIANQVLSLPLWSFTNYHLFLPIKSKNEINTQYLLSILHGKDKNVVVPRLRSKTHFSNILLTDNTRLVENSWGIPEPEGGLEVPAESIDVVFLPLLAFDRAGHRVGYGKGFYDTFLGSCRSDVIKVGLSFFEAEEIISDIGERDVPMNYCVTPETIYTF
jgi:5-formyltetrahydrofolate cyclo-ligase